MRGIFEVTTPAEPGARSPWTGPAVAGCGFGAREKNAPAHDGAGGEIFQSAPGHDARRFARASRAIRVAFSTASR